MNQMSGVAPGGVTGAGTAEELFALTDEQILGIDAPEDRGVVEAAREENRSLAGAREDRSEVGTAKAGRVRTAEGKGPEGKGAEGVAPIENGQGEAAAIEPPGWLKERMKDPWNGEEARELWEGVQQAQREAGEYREVFATPAEARALKELYPGGAAEAKNAAERARQLEELDAAYFGGAGKAPAELSAGRAQLAQRLMEQDPGAFREMVMAGMELLRRTGGNQESSNSVISDRKSKTQATGETRQDSVGVPRSFDSGVQKPQTSAQEEITRAASGDGGGRIEETVAAEYRAFESAANAELERSVGGAIMRTMEQALPNLGRMAAGEQGAALSERLKASVREEIDAALKSDTQLGEQVAKVLAGRRFDGAARSQVVRLIDARAQQLVPGAVRRVVNGWTQTAMAARRAEGVRAEEKVERAESSAEKQKQIPRVTRDDSGGERKEAARAAVGKVNYGKLSDEEILEL